MTNKEVREPIATWWRISKYRVVIEPLEVVAFTGSFVTYLVKSWSNPSGPKRERRESREDIFPSFEIAKQTAIQRAELEIESTEDVLRRKVTFLGQLESLQEPRL